MHTWARNASSIISIALKIPEKNSICFLTRNMIFDLPNELFFASLYCENRFYSSVSCWVFRKYTLWTMQPKHQRSRQPLQPSFARISSVSRGNIPFPHDQSFPVKSRRQKRKYVLRVCKRNTFSSAFVETSPGYLPLMSLDTEPREAGLLPQQKESVCPAGEKHNSETEIRHNPTRHNSEFFFQVGRTPNSKIWWWAQVRNC